MPSGWVLIHEGQDHRTSVLKVVGGWLVRCSWGVETDSPGLAFIPDPRHENFPKVVD